MRRCIGPGAFHGRLRGNVGLALVLAIVAAAATYAGPRRPVSPPYRGAAIETPPGVLQVGPRISLPRVTVAEILGGKSQISAGKWTRNGPSPLGTARVPTRIVRRLPSVWRMRLEDAREIDRIEVDYELTALNGKTSCLSAVDGRESELRAEVRNLPPVVVERDADGVIIEGGLVLYMDLESLRSAGQYSATLTVTLSHL